MNSRRVTRSETNDRARALAKRIISNADRPLVGGAIARHAIDLLPIVEQALRKTHALSDNAASAATTFRTALTAIATHKGVLDTIENHIVVGGGEIISVPRNISALGGPSVLDEDSLKIARELVTLIESDFRTKIRSAGESLESAIQELEALYVAMLERGQVELSPAFRDSLASIEGLDPACISMPTIRTPLKVRDPRLLVIVTEFLAVDNIHGTNEYWRDSESELNAGLATIARLRGVLSAVMPISADETIGTETGVLSGHVKRIAMDIELAGRQIQVGTCSLINSLKNALFI